MTSLFILASGSDGNAALLTTDTTSILIDCGLSARELARRMESIGRKPEDLDAILISHEHGDHVGGLGVVLRHGIKRGRAVPVYLTDLCAPAVDFGRIEEPPVKLFQSGVPFSIGDIRVKSFTVPHDSADPINFSFVADGVRIGFSTDLGFIPPAMQRHFADCEVIVLESNHDVEMMRVGPHPEDVKTRVAGRFGHLSNDQAAEYLLGISRVTQTVVLNHLSSDNNNPSLAEFSAYKSLSLCGSSARVLVASQTQPLRVI